MSNDLVFLPAHQLAKAIRERSISAQDVLEAHLQQIAHHNPNLNAIVTLNAEQARQLAKEADAALVRGEMWGPLHGVPVTIKDAFETEGVRTTSSHRPLASYIPKRDATVVARLRAAGALILGKTNMPELASGAHTDSLLFGRANNPWDLNRTPGGSTGGGAAALASGMSPLEIGSDLGGSIRVPAHFCGVHGLKPTDHRIPVSGHIPDLPGRPRSIRQMAVVGPLARSVEDLQLALLLLAGPDGRDTEIPPVPLTEIPPRALNVRRIAWTDTFGDIQPTLETKQAIRTLAQTLTAQGCHVEFTSPPAFDFHLALETFGELCGFFAKSAQQLSPVQRFLQAVLIGFIGSRVSKNDPFIRGFLRSARLNYHYTQHTAALARRDAYISALEQFLSMWDAWICPVSPGPAFPHPKRLTPNSLPSPIQVDGQSIPYYSGNLAYTGLFTLTGHPAVVLPLTRSQEGLPIGVQVVGKLWGEMDLLSIAAQLSEVTGPFQRPPGY